ncbi:Octaprenyl diphosphate synthase [bacterium HR39]|nr:Octaprenyl diphosphate synthase [bacterium HR39]
MNALANGPSADVERAFARARALVAEDLARVDRLVVERLESRVPLIPQLARHLVAAGGKRIRPLLTLLAARLCGYAGSRHVGLAACVEFIHTATLLHDDVVDGSELRRGMPSANAIWGNKAPVLVGDFLFSRAFQLMVADGGLRVLEILSRASAIIAEGEVAQLGITGDVEADEERYLAVIEAKTAALFEAACRVGAAVAGRDEETEEKLGAYGRNLGIAFQLVDDALDYAADRERLGKSLGDDFREGKITLPVIVAIARGSATERAFWRRTLAELDQRPGDFERAVELVRRHDAIGETLRRAQAFGEAAKAALSGFPASPLRTAMLDLVDFAIARAH